MENVRGPQFMSTNHRGPRFLLPPYLAADGITLLHGPPSAGKSQLLWQLLNAVQTGQGLWGLPAIQGNAMLLELDMRPNLLWHRWQSSGFTPHFDVTTSDPLNVASPHWLRTEDYRSLKSYHATRNYTVVGIDVLADVHTSTAMLDSLPMAVYSAFQALFPGAALIFAHHDRKRARESFYGASDEDALGSQMWKSKATIVLHLHPREEHLVNLDHTKSQASDSGTQEILFRNRDASLEPWAPPLWKKLAAEFIYLCQIAKRKPPGTTLALDDLYQILQHMRHDPYVQTLTLRQLKGIWYGWRQANAKP